jgi:hypothetical protein
MNEKDFCPFNNKECPAKNENAGWKCHLIVDLKDKGKECTFVLMTNSLMRVMRSMGFQV